MPLHYKVKIGRIFNVLGQTEEYMRQTILLLLVCFNYLTIQSFESWLYAPWRNSYAQAAHTTTPKPDCPFCAEFHEHQDEKNFILQRFEHAIVKLNTFPYSNGHLLIIPLEHLANLKEFSSQTRAELMELTMHCVEILKKTFNCDGVNVGINLGRAAGASMPNHLHIHVLPRFFADQSFIEIVGNTRLISLDFKKLYEQLKGEFQAISLASH